MGQGLAEFGGGNLGQGSGNRNKGGAIVAFTPHTCYKVSLATMRTGILSNKVQAATTFKVLHQTRVGHTRR